ncbi:MAG TPA: PAS domain-containing protein [Leptolyngbyaceae cyanobacterium M33_DOE_097]|uniref:Circadian input-output histidine kinase CikA n=1 Tax=Oscillatoriales cyanobacterium SpSt-418 TaxID=2282169 RepID=A0A7C3KFG6_9CYAN|nr:PAS domain-containing protein [Leptolyngbyaceae cyanobacterium M33_DOE_097]
MNDSSTHANPYTEEVNTLRQRLLFLEQANWQCQQKVEQLSQQLSQERIARQQTEDRLQLILSAAQVVVWEMDLTTNRVVCSPNATEIWGIQAGDGEDFFAVVHPDDRSRVVEAAKRAIAGETNYFQEYRIIRPDGTLCWLNSQGKVFLDANGRGIRMIGLSVDVTERKQTEVALRQSEEHLRVANERFQLAAKAVNCLIYDWHLDSGRVERTDGLTRLLGFSLDEVEPSGQWWHERIHPEDLLPIQARAALALKQDDYFTSEYRILNKSNQYIYVLDQCLVVERDADGNPTRIVGSTTDISDRKQAEAQLQESQRFIQQIADALPGTLYVYDMLTQRNVYVNRQIGELLGYTPEQIQVLGDQLFLKLMHPDDLAILDRQIERLNHAQNGEIVDYEYRMQHANGEWRWLWSRNTVSTRTPEGLVHQVVGTVHDITDRKQSEAELQQREQEFRTLVENTPDIIARYDRELHHLYINPSIEQAVGVAPQHFIGKTGIEMGFTDERSLSWYAAVQQVFETGQGCSIEYEFPSPNGELRLYQAQFVPELVEAGYVKTVLGVARDVTDYKQAEVSLRRSEERLRLAMAAARMASWDVDLQTGKAVWSEPHFRMLGYDPVASGEASEAMWRSRIHPQDLEYVIEAWQQARRDRTTYQAEYRVIRADNGQIAWLAGLGSFTYTKTGEAIRSIGVLFDISDRKRAETEREQLLQREQAAREQAEAANRIKDEFLAVLSHELRTPLNPILGWAKILRTRQLEASAAERALETIERNAKLQAQLIEDLLDVSRILQGKVRLNACPVNLVATIEAALETVRLSAEAKGIQIQTQLDPNVGLIYGDAGRIQQVVWNLLSNAVKFTPSGGRIGVTLERVMTGSVAAQQQGTGETRSPIYPCAQITVSDTGQGIQPDFLPHVFEYFRQADSTTTRHFGGLGLGLAIVHHLVELHGGTIQAKSPGSGMGAIFTVQLPLTVSLLAHDLEVRSPQTTGSLSGIRILVVDDEADMRDLICFILEEQGAIVDVAASAVEAYKQLNESLPDLLISDIGMPESDGYALLKQVRETLSNQGKMIPAIAYTAYAGDINQQQAFAAGFQLHLAKPVEPEQLIRSIMQLMRQTAVPSFQERN